MPKVSVIVPVYKVEPYLNKCIDSIIAQTFSDIEIILVDDGSPDRCGEICDEYAKIDPRIKVIHKQNEGPGIARNAGIDMASGDYITFVDSDDWIKPNMYQLLVDSIISNEADIAICGYFYEFERNGTQVTEVIDQPRVFNKIEALEYLFNSDYCQNYLVNKLYKATLFQNIRISDGILCEDLDIQYKLFARSEKAVYIAEALYCYAVRSDSITGVKFDARKFKAQTYTQNCVDFINENYPLLSDYANKQYIRVCYWLITCVLKDGARVKYKQQLDELYKGTLNSFDSINNKEIIDKNLIDNLNRATANRGLFEFKIIFNHKKLCFLVGAKRMLKKILKK